MSGDDGSVWGLISALALILFVWFIVIPFVGELTTTHRDGHRPRDRRGHRG